MRIQEALTSSPPKEPALCILWLEATVGCDERFIKSPVIGAVHRRSRLFVVDQLGIAKTTSESFAIIIIPGEPHNGFLTCVLDSLATLPARYAEPAGITLKLR